MYKSRPSANCCQRSTILNVELLEERQVLSSIGLVQAPTSLLASGSPLTANVQKVLVTPISAPVNQTSNVSEPAAVKTDANGPLLNLDVSLTLLGLDVGLGLGNPTNDADSNTQGNLGGPQQAANGGILGGLEINSLLNLANNGILPTINLGVNSSASLSGTEQSPGNGAGNGSGLTLQVNVGSNTVSSSGIASISRAGSAGQHTPANENTPQTRNNGQNIILPNTANALIPSGQAALLAEQNLSLTAPAPALILLPVPLDGPAAPAPGLDLVAAPEGVRSARLGLIDMNEESQAEQENFTPESSGLMSDAAPFDLGAMEKALQQFLDQLVDLRESTASWLSAAGPLPWLFVALAAGALMYELYRRRLQQMQGHDLVTAKSRQEALSWLPGVHVPENT